MHFCRNCNDRQWSTSEAAGPSSVPHVDLFDEELFLYSVLIFIGFSFSFSAGAKNLVFLIRKQLVISSSRGHHFSFASPLLIWFDNFFNWIPLCTWISFWQCLLQCQDSSHLDDFIRTWSVDFEMTLRVMWCRRNSWIWNYMDRDIFLLGYIFIVGSDFLDSFALDCYLWLATFS